MGLFKKQEYQVKELGITIPEVYAKIGHLTIDEDGKARAVFNIHNNRENTMSKRPLDIVMITTNIDKTKPIYSQVYIAAKETTFVDWEDDIIEETVTPNE